jgi:hypothetical protein
MPKRRGEGDWYVEMSDWLERREQRRKWVILGVCVAVPLALMACFLLYVLADKYGLVGKALDRLKKASQEPPEKVEQPEFGPVSVKNLYTQDVRFPQLTVDGIMTSLTHSFRELLPEGAEVFTVNRDTERHGFILHYRLRNLATGDAYDFTDVEVEKIGEEWTITERAWTRIRDQLQAKMQLRLSKPLID